MKLIIRGFSQDVDLLNLQEAEAYLVVQDEETGAVHRVPVPGETISVIMAIAHGDPGESASEEQDEGHQEPVEEEEQEEELAPPPQQRKRIVVPPVRRQPAARPPPPTSEEQVPSV